jgi:very-short-patch-repair endonuclease
MTAEPHRFARRLRATATQPEHLLWQHLRNRRCHGAKFRRQEPLGSAIVDFACHEARLVVELDGRQHRWEVDYDEARTAALARLGWRVMRFRNRAVLEDIDGVLAAIAAAVEASRG